MTATERRTSQTRPRKPSAQNRSLGGKADPPGQATDRSQLFHPDRVVGALSTVLRGIANPVRNTLAAAGVYADRPLEELFPAPARRPEMTVTGRWRLPGVISEDLVFRSLHVPIEPTFRREYRRDYQAMHLVSARRIRPATARQRPRLLYLHGYMQPETWVEELAVLTGMALALDVEVIQMQPPHHGRRAARASRYSGELYWTADLVRSVEALRQTVLDARTLLHCLEDEDDRPVGVTGISLGGALTLCLTCLEDRFAFSVPMIAHMDLAALVSDAPVLSGMRRDLRSFGWGKKEFGAFVAGLGWYDLQPKLSTDRIFILAASNDRFFRPELVRSLWQRWGKPAIRWFPTSHMGFIPQIPRALGPMREFIDRLHLT